MSCWISLGNISCRAPDVDYVEKSDYGCRIHMKNGREHFSDLTVAEVTGELNQAEYAIAMRNMKPSPNIANNYLRMPDERPMPTQARLEAKTHSETPKKETKQDDVTIEDCVADEA